MGWQLFIQHLSCIHYYLHGIYNVLGTVTQSIWEDVHKLQICTISMQRHDHLQILVPKGSRDQCPLQIMRNNFILIAFYCFWPHFVGSRFHRQGSNLWPCSGKWSPIHWTTREVPRKYISRASNYMKHESVSLQAMLEYQAF